MQEEFYRVEAYDLATFLQGVQDGVRAGYELDLTKNETYPFGSIGHYIVQLVPAKKVVVSQAVASIATPETETKKEVPVVAQVEQPKKRGPKSKVE